VSGYAARPQPRRRLDAVEALLRAHGTFVYLFLYVPILIVIVYSFNDSKLVRVWGGVTLHWYRDAWTNPQVLNPLRTSLIVAAINTVFATTLGTLAALSIASAPRPVKLLLNGLIYTALIVPEVVIALSSLLFLNGAFGWLAGLGIHLAFGIPTVVAGHVLWNLSLVILVVRARMSGMDRALVEASADLFATPWRTFLEVTLPQLAPAILAGALLSFTFSMDDVVLSTFLSGPGSTTLPMRVFSMIRFGVTPEVNAISAVMLLGTLTAILLSQWLVRRAGRPIAGGAAEPAG
jgi:spermidine/putrescine transport system permease protein